MKRKKRIKIEEVVVEALKILPRGMDIPSFTQWVAEATQQNKTLPRSRNGYEKNRRNTKSISTIQSSTTSDETSDR